MKKRHQYKYLSKSILLEESGLPRIHLLTILTITITILLFIIWSNFMVVNDTVSVKGYVEKHPFSDSGFQLIGMVASKDIASIKLNDPIKLSISGVTTKNKISGKITQINENPYVDRNGDAHYQIVVVPQNENQVMSTLTPVLYDKMDTRIEVIVGSRSLMQYFLGPLWDASNNSSY